jgi:hypothetical protein
MGNITSVFRCGVFGHRYRFAARGRTMSWNCERSCGAGGSKEYPTPEQATRYAAALDREDSQDLGRRAPLVGLFPMRLARLLRRGR